MIVGMHTIQGNMVLGTKLLSSVTGIWEIWAKAREGLFTMRLFIESSSCLLPKIWIFFNFGCESSNELISEAFRENFRFWFTTNSDDNLESFLIIFSHSLQTKEAISRIVNLSRYKKILVQISAGRIIFWKQTLCCRPPLQDFTNVYGYNPALHQLYTTRFVQFTINSWLFLVSLNVRISWCLNE